MRVLNNVPRLLEEYNSEASASATLLGGLGIRLQIKIMLTICWLLYELVLAVEGRKDGTQ